MRSPGARKNVENIYPLSPTQQGMLFHALESPDSGVYVEQITAHLDGNLDVHKFRDSWTRLIVRHGALRTLFVADKARQPLQVVRREVEAPWSVEDWSTMESTAAEARFAQRLDADRKEGFTLDQAPLSRFLLVVWPGGGYRFLWTFHHLVLGRLVHAPAVGRDP